jgi:membrane associated rhomboid family serine protease
VLPLKDYNPTTRRAWITLGIIAVNVFVYFAVQPHGQGNVDPQSEAIREAKFTYAHAAIPCEVTHGRPLTIEEINQTLNGDATACASPEPASPEAFPHKNVYLAILYSMFLHGSLLHIGGNMLFLWIFGNNIEDRMGWIGYPIFYLASGFAAAAAQIAFQPSSSVPVVGASGAIAGVMGAYLMLFPRVRIRTLFIIVIIPLIRDIRAVWLLGFWFLLQFVTAPSSGVAWMAHVGGFIFGALVTLPFLSRLRPPRSQSAIFY